MGSYVAPKKLDVKTQPDKSEFIDSNMSDNVVNTTDNVINIETL